MKRISTPKKFQELLAQHGALEIISLLNEFKATTPEGKYQHWDEFRWHIKKGIEPELAWAATKLSRKSISKQIQSLHATHDTPFSYCVPDSLSFKLHQLDQSTGGGFSLSSDSFTSKSSKESYLVKSLMMEEAITSSQLEGACTTRKIAKEMLETKREPLDKSERMIKNNYNLMKYALQHKDSELSIPLILEFHKIATVDAIENDAIPGELRAADHYTIADHYGVVAHQPPSHETLVQRLQHLCEFANQQSHYNQKEFNQQQGFMHPALRAIILHFMIGYIHPFGDGNGRTARALFYWSMLRSGYWMFEYISISKQIAEKRSEYDKAFIYTETDESDLTYFIYHQMDVIQKSVESLQLYIIEKKKEFYEFHEWVSQNKITKEFSTVAIEILKEAVKEPGKLFTAYQVHLNHDVSENTAREKLQQLERLGFLYSSQLPGTKTKSYIAPAGLREKLVVKSER